MRHFLVIIASFFVLHASAQPYKSIFGKESTIWHSYYMIVDGAETYEFEIKGDTIIDTVEYKAIGHSYGSNIYYGIREDTITGRAWIYDMYATCEYLFMDLSLEVGDTFKVDQCLGYYNPIMVVDSIYYKNDLKHIVFDEDIDYWFPFIGLDTVIFMESMGSTHFMFPGEAGSTILCKNTDGLNSYEKLGPGECYLSWVGVDEYPNNVGATISPNPVNRYALIKFIESNMELTAVRVFDYLGRERKVNVNYSTKQIDFDNLPSGIYFVNVSTNERDYRLKIIKE